MKISVVIPVYNEEKYIETCLNALTNQQVKADEIIIVDNNCNDQTINIAKKFPVKIIKEETQGITPARNAGFNNASYEIIAKIDADSIVPPNWVQRIKEDFNTDEICGVSGPLYYKNSVYLLKPLSLAFFTFYFMLCRLIQGHDILHGSNLAVTRDAWQKIKDHVCIDDNKVHEDLDLAIHLHKVGKIKYDPLLQVQISLRRITKHPYSGFIEYPIRTIKTLKFTKHE